MDLEHRIERLEGRHGRPWRRDDLFDHVSDDELRDMFVRVIAVVNPEEKAYLESLRRDLFGEDPEERPG
jgi:hypothetical protein